MPAMTATSEELWATTRNPAPITNQASGMTLWPRFFFSHPYPKAPSAAPAICNERAFPESAGVPMPPPSTNNDRFDVTMVANRLPTKYTMISTQANHFMFVTTSERAGLLPSFSLFTMGMRGSRHSTRISDTSPTL